MNGFKGAVTVAAGVSTLWAFGLMVNALATKDDVVKAEAAHDYKFTGWEIRQLSAEQRDIELAADEVPLTAEERIRLREIEESKAELVQDRERLKAKMGK